MDHQIRSIVHSWMRFVIGLSLALAVWVGAAAPAQAGQTTVVGTGTAASCSLTALQSAVLSGANPLLVTFNCGASPVVIPVTSSITFNAQIADITIDGGAPGLITLSGSTVRIIDQRLQENLTVKNLTFTGGSATGTCSPNNACAGGAIYNPSGTLTVMDSTFTNNSAGPSTFEQHKGGAIYSDGPLSVTGSTFSNNQVPGGDGGAIYAVNATITNTRFANNSSAKLGAPQGGRGGALYAAQLPVAGISMQVTASSFTGNTASDSGGAIYKAGSGSVHSFVVANSTFSGNSAQVSGGALSLGASLSGIVRVTNATISGNSVVSGTGAGIGGQLTMLTNSIISNNTPGGNCSVALPDGGGNVVFGDTTCPGTNANPVLGALTGTVPYFPLGAGSAAINRGVASACDAAAGSPGYGASAVDQRGVPRRAFYCDSGAFEAQPASLAVFAGSNQNAAVNTSFGTLLQAQVLDSFSNKLAGTPVTFTGPASGAGIVNAGGTPAVTSLIAYFGATANGTVGTYNVAASTPGATSANFTLTNRNPYAVTYSANGNTGGSVPVDGNYYAAAATVTVLGNTGALTRIGSTFGGWNTLANGSGTNYAAGNTFPINANVTLYAKWTAVQTYSVTYSGNGNTGGTAPTDANAYVAAETVTTLGNNGNLVKTGSTFAGWNTAANGSGTSYAVGTTFTINANATLFAQWTLNPTFSVTYIGNGNTGGSPPVDGSAYVAGATVTVAGNTGALTRVGYTFAGWNTAANGGGTGYPVGATFTINANATLFAQWTLNPTFSVTYIGNGNTGGSPPVDGNAYVAGATVTVAGNTGAMTRVGYTFAGWNTAANGGGANYAAGATFAINANVTLYAKWTALPTYSVTYNGNGNTGGTPPTDANAYVAAATVTALGNNGNLVKTGSTFSGWNSAANGSGTSYAAGTTFTINANAALFAQWTLNPTFGVTYIGNGNTGGTLPIDGSAYVAGATVTVAGNTGVLTRVGYAFAGWNTAANGGGTNYAAGNTFPINANVTLYAKWTALPTYSVTYSGNGNTGGTAPTDANAYVAGATVTALGNNGNLVKTGLTFLGWNTAANGSGTSYGVGTTFAIGSGNMTLFAIWGSLVTCTLDVDGNDSIDPLTDGLMIVRAMLGFTGTAVTNGAVGGGTPTRATWNLIQPYLNTYCGTSFLP